MLNFPCKVLKFCSRADKLEKQEGNTLRDVNYFKYFLKY